MRKVISFTATLLILVSLAMPAFAAEPQLDHVTDAAQLLTEEERMELERKAREVSEEYQCGVYIITLEDFTEYSYETTIYEAAKEIYLLYDLGLSSEKSGVLLMLSMAERDYVILAYGYGNTAFTDYGKDKLAESFLGDFGNDEWYAGFEHYLLKSESMLERAREGAPLDVNNTPGVAFLGLFLCLAFGCLVAFVVCSILKGQMKSAAVKTEADSYIRPGGVVFTNRQDRFTHTTQTRVKIEKAASGSGGGTTRDSSGFSGKSGKF